MGDLTRNLSRSEFACKCGCGMDTIDYQLVEMLQQCADWFMDREDESMVERISIIINSGNRCAMHNISEGGGKKSQHLFGRAADFRMQYVMKDGSREPVDDNEVADYLQSKYIGLFGIGRYNGRTHFDTRSGPSARWDMR